MKRGEFSDSIPIDLILEILLLLPSKSIARFRCVSKLWGSMLRRSYFTELFLTRSRASPRLLFAFVGAIKTEWNFYSVPQLQNPHEKASLVVTADFHMKMNFCKSIHPEFCEHTSGLIYFSHVRKTIIWGDHFDTSQIPVICNPNTGQCAILPSLESGKTSVFGFSGFDPIDKQFKLLFMSSYPNFYGHYHKIMTLGTGKLKWRAVQCPLKHNPLHKGICINGVLYYLARSFDKSHETSHVIVCFDIRSETFRFVDAECFCSTLGLYHLRLVNYKGKLGGISYKYVNSTLEVSLCVLKDVEKQEWLNHVYTFRDENEMLKVKDVLVAGMTATGEIVLSKKLKCKPFYVFYFNPERNTLQRVEIQGFAEGFGRHREVYVFVDHVEDLHVNDVIPLKPRRGLNISRERPNPKQKSYYKSPRRMNHWIFLE